MCLAGCFRVQGDQAAVEQQGADALERVTGAGPVRDVLEEFEDTEHLVGLRFRELVDTAPHHLGRGVSPRVIEPASVQDARDLAGLDQRDGVTLGGHPPGRVRSLREAGQHERRAAVGRGDRDQPVDGAAHQVFVPGVGRVHDAQRHLDGGRLAGRRAEVRLQGVPEAAVRVPVGRYRVPHRFWAAALE